LINGSSDSNKVGFSSAGLSWSGSCRFRDFSKLIFEILKEKKVSEVTFEITTSR
jgi:hypothetical protein